MNSTSLIFAVSVAGGIAATAWLIDWGAARSGHWGARKRFFVRWGMIALALVAGIFIYRTDANLRGTTLFEVAGPWEENGGKIWPVTVEHPGVEHTLTVRPFVLGPESAGLPLNFQITLGQRGKAALVDEATVHQITSKSGRKAKRREAKANTWTSATFSFTPLEAGPHEVNVRSIDGVVPPLLHIRISDPAKRDGKRAPGY